LQCVPGLGQRDSIVPKRIRRTNTVSKTLVDDVKKRVSPDEGGEAGKGVKSKKVFDNYRIIARNLA